MSTKTITSRDNPLLARLRKLAADGTAYRKFGEVWIEGEHLCSAFIQHGGAVPQAVISESGWQQTALRQLASAAGEVAVVPDALMAGLSTLESPAPVCFAVPWAGAGTLDVDSPSVVLDRLQDAGNVGNILRSAAAFGFTQIIAIKGTAALWSPKVLRAGMGAHFHLECFAGVDLGGFTATFPGRLIATQLKARQSVFDTDLTGLIGLIFGNEGAGLSQTLLGKVASVVAIPMPGQTESLNIAAAAAVCLFERVRQLG